MTTEQATTDKVRQAASLLSALPPNPRKGRRGELRDMVEELRPQLIEAHEVKKYTWEEICTFLKDAGIEISVHTLKTYMRIPKGETHEQSTADLPAHYPNQGRGSLAATSASSFSHLPQSKKDAKEQFKVR